MKYKKTIICLANSRKLSGRCIAGKEIISGKISSWVRPISNRPTGELSEEDRRYPDGQDAKMLDIIEIPMIEAKPHSYQSENHLIDAEYHWEKVRHATLAEVRSAIDVVKGPLWQSAELNPVYVQICLTDVASCVLKQSLIIVIGGLSATTSTANGVNA